MSGLTDRMTAPPRLPVTNSTDGMVTFNLREPIASFDWSPDGNHLAVAGTEGTLVLVNARTGELRHRLAGHRNGAIQVWWSPNGLWIASGGQDGTIRLWHFQTGELFR